MTTKDTLFRAVTAVHRGLFDTTSGRIGGRASGMPVVKLTTTGRTTGKPRTTMLTSPLQVGDSVILIASFGGDDREPAWCKNLREHPDVEIVMQGKQQAMRAHIADSAERDRLWPTVTAAHPNYAGYQRKTTREIPVVVLDPIS